MRYRLSQTYLREVTVQVDGKLKKMTWLEAIFLTHCQKAIRGDTRALQFLVKFAEQLGFLEQVLEGRPLRPMDFVSGNLDPKKLTDEELDEVIRLHQKAFVDTAPEGGKPN